MVFGPSKHRLSLLVVAGLGIVVGLGFWLVRPYLGFLPLLRKPPIDLGNAFPSTSTQPSVPTPGKNETGLPLELPEGFSMNVFAKGLGAPRDLLALPDGALLASIPSQGKVVILKDKDRDGMAETAKTLLSGLHEPHGLAMTDVHPGDLTAALYVAETDALVEYLYDASKDEATGRKVLARLATGGRHTTKSLLLVEGDLYVSIGSSCDVCHEENPQRAAIYHYDFDKQVLEPYAKGLRNSVFMANRRKGGEIWATEMGRDFLGDDLPPDEINVIKKDKNYGWPNCYGNNIHDTEFDKNTYIRNPCMEPFETPSQIDLPAHSAPLGIEFLPPNSLSGVWGDYGGNLLVAYHGSWNRTVATGYKIHRFVLDDAGNVLRDDDFISGWLDEKGVLGRPVDVEYSEWQDALFVSDDRAGLVYRIVPPKR